MERLSKNLKEWRIKRGLSMEQLAEKSGKSKSTIYRIENAQVFSIAIDTIRDLSVALQCTIEDLTGRSSLPEGASELHAGFGLKIKQLRKKRGLTQEGLARLLGKDPSTLHRWEHETTAPSPGERLEISRVLEVHERVLFGGETAPELLNFESALELIAREHEELVRLRQEVELLRAAHESIGPIAALANDETVLLEAYRSLPKLSQLAILALATRRPEWREAMRERYRQASEQARKELTDMMGSALVPRK
jgi:transcriptional regulator with XRE-family HTH domain